MSNKRPLQVAASPLTGKIYAGNVLKDGMTWASNKQDVTIDSLVAVAQHVVKLGRPVEIRRIHDDFIEYRITVEKFEPE